MKKDVDSFYELPVQLIKHIIKRLNIHQCLHAQQLLEKEKIENINIEKIYKKNYLKLLLSNDLQCYKFHSFNNYYFSTSQWHKKYILETLTKSSSFYRKVCIQYLVEQWIKNSSQEKWSTVFNEYIQGLIQNEKESIKELCLTLTEHAIDPVILNDVGVLDKLTLRIDKINPTILENMEVLLDGITKYERAYIRTPLKINFDIQWNKKLLERQNEDNINTNCNTINDNNSNYNNNSNNSKMMDDREREENMMEIAYLINSIFNKKFGQHSSLFKNRGIIIIINNK